MCTSSNQSPRERWSKVVLLAATLLTVSSMMHLCHLMHREHMMPGGPHHHRHGLPHHMHPHDGPHEGRPGFWGKGGDANPEDGRPMRHNGNQPMHHEDGPLRHPPFHGPENPLGPDATRHVHEFFHTLKWLYIVGLLTGITGMWAGFSSKSGCAHCYIMMLMVLYVGALFIILYGVQTTVGACRDINRKLLVEQDTVTITAPGVVLRATEIRPKAIVEDREGLEHCVNGVQRMAYFLIAILAVKMAALVLCASKLHQSAKQEETQEQVIVVEVPKAVCGTVVSEELEAVAEEEDDDLLKK